MTNESENPFGKITLTTVQFQLYIEHVYMYQQTRYVLTIRGQNKKKQVGYAANDKYLTEMSHEHMLWDLAENLQLSCHPALHKPIESFIHHLGKTGLKSSAPFDVPIIGEHSDLLDEYDNRVFFDTSEGTWTVTYQKDGKGPQKYISVDMNKYFDQIDYYTSGYNSWDIFAHHVVKLKVLNGVQMAHLRTIIKGKEYPPSVQQETKFSPGGVIYESTYEPYPGDGVLYVGFKSDGNTISNPPTGGRPEILKKLGGMLKVKVEYPCRHKIIPKAALEQIIIHLNDQEKWTREQIADWLDLLHESGTIDLSIQSPNEDKA